MLVEKDKESLEKYSSAVSLSDMEIFIFPELMFSLVLANIMSPVIWKWKEDVWFKNLDKISQNKKIQRIKQYIMNNFDFNLDLNTWGLTTKEKELERFKKFIKLDVLKQSNALFGYEGDKYYFDIDIRRHFGLDKYTDNTIPYWKTETIEAMSSFQLKEGYAKGAGECVSLSTMYYAALFILGGVFLEDIYMMATPLHSQNFIDIGEGIITNNRRIVIKNMWFNGTEISMKARRAIENEQITFVANNLGYVHRIYKEATMPKEVYLDFSSKINSYLESKLNYAAITSFLRCSALRQVCFQFEIDRFGKKHYIEAEKVFPYEHGSPYLLGSSTQNKLLEDIDIMEYYSNPIEGRINLKDIEEVFASRCFTVADLINDTNKIKNIIFKGCKKIENILGELIVFCKTNPQLPDVKEKKWLKNKPIILKKEMNREDIISYLESRREDSEVADLAFLAYRDIKGAGYLKAFLKAAFERNPVSVAATKELTIAESYNYLKGLKDGSIYSENRLAQPDEIFNFNTGDGLEKALALVNIGRERYLESSLETIGNKVQVFIADKKYSFETNKKVTINKEDCNI